MVLAIPLCAAGVTVYGKGLDMQTKEIWSRP